MSERPPGFVEGEVQKPDNGTAALLEARSKLMSTMEFAENVLRATEAAAQRPEVKQSELQFLATLDEMVDRKIGHEVNWVGQRFNALMTSQSFLFGAFAVMVVAEGTRPEVQAVQMGLPVLGLVISVVVFRSLTAAIRVMEELGDNGAEVTRRVNVVTGIAALRLPPLSIRNRDGLSWTIDGGHAAMKYVPGVIAVAWGLIESMLLGQFLGSRAVLIGGLMLAPTGIIALLFWIWRRGVRGTAKTSVAAPIGTRPQ